MTEPRTDPEPSPQPPASLVSDAARLQALALVSRGTVYDLDCGRWTGMPLADAHPPFQVLNYRTPRGVAAQREDWLGSNESGFGWHSELVSGTVHSGTHIDALCHVTHGSDRRWFGGGSSDEAFGDFGPRRLDASELPTIIARGVLLDVAAAAGVTALAAGEQVGPRELEGALERQGTQLRGADAVLLRTGYGSVWPDPRRIPAHKSAGLNLAGAEYLRRFEPIVVGADTEALECTPSGVPGNEQPVHVELIAEAGILIVEMLELEELAAAGIHEFCFVCLPLKIAGASGSMVRPIALI